MSHSSRLRLLEGKTIVVTGGASGIGRDCAIAYAREGAHVVILDKDASAGESAASDLEVEGLAIQCDVLEGTAIEAAIGRAIERFSSIDAVHNNVGVSSPSVALHETSEAEWDTLFSINLKSVFWTTKYAMQQLRNNHGSILCTASLVGLIGQANHAAYVATKGAMIALTKAMALDYAPWNIRVNCICPAGVWTPLLRDWANSQPSSQISVDYLNNIHALGYCPKPDVVADAAVFLLSDKARFITGCSLPVSGGAELGYRR